MKPRIYQMLSIIICTVLLSSCTMSTGANPQHTDLHEQNLNGKVIKVVQKRNFIPDEANNQRYEEITEFNKAGMITKKEYYHNDELSYLVERFYEDGKKTRVVSNDIESITTSSLVYNEAGSLIRIDRKKEDVKGTARNSTLGFHKRIDISYGEDKLTEIYGYYDIDDKLVQTVEKMYNKDRKIIFRKTIRYRARNGTIVAEITEELKYDSKGNNIRRDVSQDGELSLSYKSTYDKYNNYVSIEILHAQDNLAKETNFKYTYDKQNNWIIQEVYSDDKLIQRVTRDITYR